MELIIAVAVFAGVVGFVAGIIWGRKLEQETVGKALAEFRKVDSAARDAWNRLSASLPFLKKHL